MVNLARSLLMHAGVETKTKRMFLYIEKKMNKIKLTLVALLVCFSIMGFSAENDAYKLKQGDAIFVSVYGEDALNKEVRILPDGSVSFPLVGRLSVVGLNTSEVEAKVTQELKEFLPEPQVTVIVSGIEGNKIYLVGKVLRPGAILLSSPTTALQALSASGGFDKFADLDAIKILRVSNGATEVLPIKYQSLLHGKELATNVELKAGDTIVVP